MRHVLAALVTTLLAFWSAPAIAETVGIGRAADDYLLPLLQSVGGAARINYAGICTGDGKLHLPRVDAEAAPQAATGLAAVRQIFRNDPHVTVTQDPSGMLTITIGSVLTSPLQTRLPALTFDSYAQRIPLSATESVMFELRAYAVEHRLHFDAAAYVVDHIVSDGGPSYLPPTMKDVTVDEALDAVARAFHLIVLYGTCTQPDGKELFEID